ncbi:MAG: lipopolysaccharide biosynthesis protein [Aquabacterium sp.]
MLLVTYGLMHLVPPVYTARTTFLPPSQQQPSPIAALSQLGALSALAGPGIVRTPADQYVALLQSVTVEDRLVDAFKLVEVYGSPNRTRAREALERSVRVAVGRKDGLVSIEVDDTSAERAAAIANRFVEELRRLTSQLALTEAQQRRQFFGQQLQQTRDRLAASQQALLGSGFSGSTLRAEPRAMAEGYARLRAEATAAEVRLQTMRRNLSDQAPEVQNALAALSALRAQLAQQEVLSDVKDKPDYVGKYREFKYQETLFELLARQYESARLDESREGGLIQVVDPAQPPEVRSGPRRVRVAGIFGVAALVLVLLHLVLRQQWRQRGQQSSLVEAAGI